MKDKEIRKKVREGYAEIAEGKRTCCSPVRAGCCSGKEPGKVSKKMGYSDEELGSIPEGADLGLGCGNPVALASLKEGETVLDLGSGAGIDCFLAAKKVGPEGLVIGVDMTPEMLARARRNAEAAGLENVEFRKGEIEDIPVRDGRVDVVISNCVINLSPDKAAVFAETYRVLRKGGRLMVSDIVTTKPLPDKVRENLSAYVGCLSGALMKDDYLDEIRKAGFSDVKVVSEAGFSTELLGSDASANALISELGLTGEELKDVIASVLSIKVSAVKK